MVDVNCNVVLAIPVKNCAQYLGNLMRQIDALDYPKEKLSIAIVENDSTDDSWEKIQQIEQDLKFSPYRSVCIEKRDTGFILPHSSRHRNEVQVKRLRNLAVIRQYIVDSYLDDNDYLFWIDADYIYLPPNTISELLKPRHDIIVPILYLPGGILYDRTTCRIGQDGNNIKIDELMMDDPESHYIRVDLANAPFMASRRAFKMARYECEDTDQEGPCFCRQAAKSGIFPYAAVNVRIIHPMSESNMTLQK